MKRDPFLVPLSREHHTALSLANRLKKVAASGVPEIVEAGRVEALEAFRRELEAHFSVEESSLLPLLAAAREHELVARTLAEHDALRDAAHRLQTTSHAGATHPLAHFAELLAAHVRFEERELFERLQTIERRRAASVHGARRGRTAGDASLPRRH